MLNRQPALGRFLNGGFDVLLAAALAVLASVAHATRGEMTPAIIDLAACLSAALTTKWPRVAGVALGAVLLTLLFTPPQWSSLGEYAALIPILGTGIRGQRRTRAWMTVYYGAVLAALTYEDVSGGPVVVFGILAWAALIAVLRGIGNLFTAYRDAQAKAHAAALQGQRLSVARDLHDTVARELTRASLHAQAAFDAQPTPALESVVTGIQRASAELRWMLALLRDPYPALPTDTLNGTAPEALVEATAALRARGFTITTTADGNLDMIPAALLPTVRAVIGEACANIERHADPEQPCAIIVSVSGNTLDALFLNGLGAGEDAPKSGGMGLVGLRERLALVGGELGTEQEGSQWIARATIPL